MSRAATLETILSRPALAVILDYDPTTGVFTWLIHRNSFGGRVKPGAIAGTIDKNGYRMIGIDGLMYPAHRLAWYWVHGRWPTVQVDHKNMTADDNRIDNLREASMTNQRANQRVRKDSLSGLKGVQKTKTGLWRSRIRKSGIVYELGYYSTPELAHAAYCKKAKELFGEFARAA